MSSNGRSVWTKLRFVMVCNIGWILANPELWILAATRKQYSLKIHFSCSTLVLINYYSNFIFMDYFSNLILWNVLTFVLFQAKALFFKVYLTNGSRFAECQIFEISSDVNLRTDCLYYSQNTYMYKHTYMMVISEDIPNHQQTTSRRCSIWKQTYTYT